MRYVLSIAGACALTLSASAAVEVRDYASDPDFAARFRADALAMAKRKSAALGGNRIAVGGRFRGHFQSDAVSSVFWALETEKGEFPITETLDNFYRFADPDGFINREYAEDGTPVWSTEHPISFITPMLAWGELAIADSPVHAVPGRLAKVYPALRRHHAVCRGRWRRPDGLYYSSPLGSGMDDLPRWPRGWTDEQIAKGGIPFTRESFTPKFADGWDRWGHSHAGMESWNRQCGWIDISAAMALDAKCLATIADRLGRADEAAAYREEYAELKGLINRLCWDEELGFYCDVMDGGVTVKRRHLGALWAMVSGVATPERVERMKRHLFDPNVFYRLVPLASLERGDPDYVSERLYWRGPAWPRLNHLAIRGLLAYGHKAEAERLARRWYNCCASLFERFGGHYENVSSEQLDHPKTHLCAPDYTGDACLTPVLLPRLFGWNGKPVAREPLMVTLTFDDSTADHVIAAKSLEKRGWTGSFNIITGWIGREGKNGGRKGAELTWDEVRAIRKAGHQVNSHTANHVRLKKLAEDGKLDEIRREFADSKAAIEKETGVAPKYLCHPFVQTTPEVDRMIVEAGMLPMTDLRINFGGEDNDPGTETDLGHKLDKWYADGIKARDLMFHGIDKEVGVWRPFKSLADWEKTLDMLKEREQKGLVKVLNYDDFYAYARKIGAAPAVVMKQMEVSR